MRPAVVIALVLAACSSSQTPGSPDAATTDAARPDGATADAATPDAASPDAATLDAAAPDAATPDARLVDAASPDAASPDAATPDGSTPTDASAPDGATTPDAALPVDAGGLDAPGCAIAGGAAIALDGSGDLAAYPAAQAVPINAPFAGDDAVRLSWSPTALYLTVHSTVFADGSRPFHLYVQAATTLPAAAPSTGKEYGGLVAQLPFTATHLIAIRRTDDFGSGAYDGVYVPGAATAWTDRATPLVPGTDVFASSDQAELSVRVPWSALGGCPLRLRVAGHVVNGAGGNEWKTILPAAHTPWMSPGGTAYTIDLTGPAAVAGWTQ